MREYGQAGVVRLQGGRQLKKLIYVLDPGGKETLLTCIPKARKEIFYQIAINFPDQSLDQCVSDDARF
jgi:hypothetical protein